jgi:phenylalanyl-tRNA synthetase alpha chain
MELKKLIDSLSPNERKILPFLDENVIDISKKSNLDKTSVLRSLEYLQNKGIIEIKTEKKKIIDVGVNGALYRKKGLPERRLLNALNEKRILPIPNAIKIGKLSQDEFKASLGALKKKAMIELQNGKIVLNAKKEEIAKKSLEEQFIERLPKDFDSLEPEEHFALKTLEQRKGIILIEEKKKITIKITNLGKRVLKEKIKDKDLIEQITPKILCSEKNWKGKKFRRYDITSPVPELNGGKRHFVNQSIDYARNIWKEMGFSEMTGPMIDSSFWIFDALFSAQDHPIREMQDTFFIDKLKELPEKNLVEEVKKAHEKGVGGSIGWRYSWSKEDAKKAVLRTHTTSLSARKLSQIKKDKLPQKFFAIGKCFRNETVDWSHGFEFNQTEGIVIDKNANFRNLLGYLKQFFKKMGFEEIRFRPAYFPYTEPSVEIDVWHPEKKVWLELGGAGMFRPEMTIPLLGEHIPVLAWGPGFDRILMDYYNIKDLRELYKNNIKSLREKKFWIK